MVRTSKIETETIESYLNKEANEMERNEAIALGKALADVAGGRLLSVHDNSDGYDFDVETDQEICQYSTYNLELANGWVATIGVM
jgi:hypothetical protein